MLDYYIEKMNAYYRPKKGIFIVMAIKMIKQFGTYLPHKNQKESIRYTTLRYPTPILFVDISLINIYSFGDYNLSNCNVTSIYPTIILKPDV